MAALERIEHSEPTYRKLRGKDVYVMTAEPIYKMRSALFFLQRSVLRRKLPFTSEQMQKLLSSFDVALDAHFSTYLFPASGIAKAFKDFVDRGEDFKELTKTAESIVRKAAAHPGRDVQKLTDRILTVIGKAPELPIRPGEAWADAAIEYVDKATKKNKEYWRRPGGSLCNGRRREAHQEMVENGKRIGVGRDSRCDC